MDHGKTGAAHAGNSPKPGANAPEQHVGVQEQGRTQMAVRDMIERCRRGDRIAFESIVKLYEKRVFAFQMSCTHNFEEARDLTQDTFIRIWQRLDQYDTTHPFTPWLITVARRLFLSSVRGRRKNISLDYLMDEELLTPVAPSVSPEENWWTERRQSLVMKALDDLDLKAREILFLKDILELPYSDIAIILCIPEGTVASRVYYARKSLRETLQRREDIAISTFSITSVPWLSPQINPSD